MLTRTVSLNDFSNFFKINFPFFEEIQKAIKTYYAEFPFSFQNNNIEQTNDAGDFLSNRYNDAEMTTAQRGIQQENYKHTGVCWSRSYKQSWPRWGVHRDFDRGTFCRGLQNGQG